MLVVDLYFGLLLLLLQSSLEPWVQSDIGGRLSLTMSHLLSGPRLSITCVFTGKLQSSVLLFVSLLFHSSRAVQLSSVLISCLSISWEIFPSMFSRSLNYDCYDNNSKHLIRYLLCVSCSQCIAYMFLQGSPQNRLKKWGSARYSAHVYTLLSQVHVCLRVSIFMKEDRTCIITMWRRLLLSTMYGWGNWGVEKFNSLLAQGHTAGK